ncbi:universal stress protein [Jatrophihabitans sp.]|uniref:universal stress protein n=1 Tax=Jatrophihabitans sp. TaxID=1932789 RepID=UPI0030C6A929
MSDDEYDSEAVAWAVNHAGAGDVVHLVHSYVPVRIAECSWQPVARERDARRRGAERTLARAMRRVRAAHPQLQVEGSVVAGLAADVLYEFSTIVDLVVVSEDRPTGTAGQPPAHHVAQRLAHSAGCPVAVVPSAFDSAAVGSAAPVTVLVDTAEIPSDVLDFAYDEAARLGSSLCVAQLWTALHEAEPLTAGLVAERQQQLDAQLAGLHRPDHPIGIFAELVFDDFDDTLLRLRSASRVLVAASTHPRMGRLTGHSAEGSCPVIIVPAARAAWR